jgi:Tfp pilus assembly protein PilF
MPLTPCSGFIMAKFFRLALCALVLWILPQCADKGSDEYVDEGIEYTNKQKYDQAMESFQNALKKNPKNTRAHYSLGGIYNYKKMFPKAEESFKTAIRLDPAHFNAYYSLGFTYELMGNKEDAEKNFQRSRELKEKLDALIDKETKSR